jgi:hypothetical protein
VAGTNQPEDARGSEEPRLLTGCVTFQVRVDARLDRVKPRVQATPPAHRCGRSVRRSDRRDHRSESPDRTGSRATWRRASRSRSRSRRPSRRERSTRVRHVGVPISHRVGYRGRYRAVLADAPGALLAQLAVVDGNTLSVVDASTGQTTELTSTEWTPVSPEGTRLVFGERGGSIYSVDARGRASVRCSCVCRATSTRSTRSSGHRTCSRLAILNDLGAGDWRLFVLNADGSDVRVLVEDAPVSGFDWSPDGTRIAFTESYDAELQVGSRPPTARRRPSWCPSRMGWTRVATRSGRPTGRRSGSGPSTTRRW